MSDDVRTYAPAAGQNYGGNEGLIVYLSDAGIVTLQTDPAIATGKIPLGVIEWAENAVNGAVGVRVAGIGRVKTGAAIVYGTDNPIVMANGSSKAIKATDTNFAVGMLTGDCSLDAADNTFHQIIVRPAPYRTA